jgi:hypothetical protein
MKALEHESQGVSCKSFVFSLSFFRARSPRHSKRGLAQEIHSIILIEVLLSALSFAVVSELLFLWIAIVRGK